MCIRDSIQSSLRSRTNMAPATSTPMRKSVKATPNDVESAEKSWERLRLGVLDRDMGW